MGEKTKLIVLPGLLCDEALWAHQVEHLADIADITVADLTRCDNTIEMAIWVLKRAPERFALAGLSMGGYVALEIMRHMPERVERLALLDTNEHADTPEMTRRRLGLMDDVENGKFREVTENLLNVVVHPDNVTNPAMRDAVLAMSARVGKHAFLKQQDAIMNRADCGEVLPGIACPTLVMCGAQDGITPPGVHEIIAHRIGKNATLKIIEHCGHLSPLEQPEIVTDAMREWLLRQA